MENEEPEPESATLRRIRDLNLAVDDGMTIGSLFIPDGTYRIYDPETSAVLAEGGDLREAWRNYMFR